MAHSNVLKRIITYYVYYRADNSRPVRQQLLCMTKRKTQKVKTISCQIL